MSRDWEEQFRKWAQPPAKSELERCENAESAIRNAVKNSEKLRQRSVSVFVQGSYRNNTNVRQDSDVDIGVLCTDTFFYLPLPEGRTSSSLGITPATYRYDQFKKDVEDALVEYLGRSAVKRGNKAFDVHETSYHVEADVAPLFEHRRYQAGGDYVSGVELLTDRDQSRVINWPEQHYKNGVEKNRRTGMRFKSMCRIIKALSVEMVDNQVAGGDLPGFLIECLVWNVPDNRLGHQTLTEDVRASLVFLYDHTQTEAACHEWGEVSEMKYLFRTAQKWTREGANAFILAARGYAALGG